MTSLPLPEPESTVPSAAARIRGALAGLLAADSQMQPHSAGTGRPTDEAELALYTVDGLVEALQWANEGVSADETACLWLAYLRWARLRGLPVDDGAPAAPARPLDRLLAGAGGSARPDAPAGRALTLPDMGTTGRPVNPEADDDGALLRSVPAGLIPYIPEEAAARIALNGAALTHGHPLAQQAAAALAAVVHALAEGRAPQAAVAAAAAAAASVPELVRALASAEAEGAAGRLPAADPVLEGSGQRADVVLAAAVQAVLAVAAGAQLSEVQLPERASDGRDGDGPQRDQPGGAAVRTAGPDAARYRSAVHAAAAAGGPVAGAAAGALIGTWLGEGAVPAVSAEAPAAALDLVAADLIRVTGSAAGGQA